MSVAIIGSGFAGSLLAWILASRDVPVTLVDAQTHPRFAIGESSTPIADRLLQRLGETYGLRPLVELSTYGSWKKSHPKLTCGKKRGFSYFHHEAGSPFSEQHVGQRSLMVTASQSDAGSDTHWLRSDVDEYFFKQAILSGATPHSATSVVDIEPVGNQYRIVCGGNFTGEVFADHIIDASGRASATAKLFGKTDLRDSLKTQSSVRFGHFKNVRPWNEYLIENGLDTSIDPFDPDDAAQHHVGPFADGVGGWTWMLRFDNDITSVGFCSPTGASNPFDQTPAYQWMMQDAEQVHPAFAGALIQQDWVQTYHHAVVADRVWLMPTAAITMDPLHSTGIAHALAGVERLAEMILSPQDASPDRYAAVIDDEVSMLDELIRTAYEVMDDVDRFHAACMVYFAAAIVSEESLQRGERISHLYNASEGEFRAAAFSACETIRDRTNPEFAEIAGERIAKWNSAGLFATESQNRYAYTATKP